MSRSGKIPPAVDLDPVGISDAADWLVDHWSTAARPLLPTLRCMFGLNLLQAVAAIREANARREVLR